ncbi:MAG: M24 family metallopeptidase [Haloarculaceae archaeon]
MSFQDRLATLQAGLADRDADAMALYPGPNTLYLAGFFGEPLDRHLLVCVPETGEPWVVTPRKSLDLVRDQSPIEKVRVTDANDSGAVSRRFAEELPGEVDDLLVDGRAPFSVTGPLDAAADAALDTADPLLTEARIRKDDGEVAALERSAAVADEVSEEIRAKGPRAVGATERELAQEIRGLLHAKGATRLSFDVVVASGPNAANPYLRHGDRRIREGEPVVLDFGAFVDGYASDQTRTVVFGGAPPDGFEAAYDAVRAALDAGVEAVEPGIPVGTVDDAANAVVEEHGFGENLVHATGHGVGLEAHEAPTVAGGNDRPLEPGMVFSVEPGVYVEGEWGVRVEDLVVVTGDGCRRLNHSPRTWKPL